MARTTAKGWRQLEGESVDLATMEAAKIKGAIRTDFVLSAEIVVIALGTVAGASFATQVAVLSGIGVLMTVGVYGIVAGIVKMDDLGLYLLTEERCAGESSRPRPRARRAAPDEGADRDRYGGNVHGRGQHPQPRHSARPSLHRKRG
jgi:hypothetical protein